MYLDHHAKRVYYVVPFKSEASAKLYAFDANLRPWDYNIELLDECAEEIALGMVTNCEFFVWRFGLLECH